MQSIWNIYFFKSHFHVGPFSGEWTICRRVDHTILLIFTWFKQTYACQLFIQFTKKDVHKIQHSFTLFHQSTFHLERAIVIQSKKVYYVVNKKLHTYSLFFSFKHFWNQVHSCDHTWRMHFSFWLFWDCGIPTKICTHTVIVQVTLTFVLQ